MGNLSLIVVLAFSLSPKYPVGDLDVWYQQAYSYYQEIQAGELEKPSSDEWKEFLKQMNWAHQQLFDRPMSKAPRKPVLSRKMKAVEKPEPPPGYPQATLQRLASPKQPSPPVEKQGVKPPRPPRRTDFTISPQHTAQLQSQIESVSADLTSVYAELKKVMRQVDRSKANRPESPSAEKTEQQRDAFDKAASKWRTQLEKLAGKLTKNQSKLQVSQQRLTILQAKMPEAKAQDRAEIERHRRMLEDAQEQLNQAVQELSTMDDDINEDERDFEIRMILKKETVRDRKTGESYHVEYYTIEVVDMRVGS